MNFKAVFFFFVIGNFYLLLNICTGYQSQVKSMNMVCDSLLHNLLRHWDGTHAAIKFVKIQFVDWFVTLNKPSSTRCESDVNESVIGENSP